METNGGRFVVTVSYLLGFRIRWWFRVPKSLALEKVSLIATGQDLFYVAQT
jgi:hypothetical protein